MENFKKQLKGLLGGIHNIKITKKHKEKIN